MKAEKVQAASCTLTQPDFVWPKTVRLGHSKWGVLVGGFKTFMCFILFNLSTEGFGHLVALYRAIWLRFGCGFESCDANGPRNVKNINLAKHRPVFLPPLLLVGSKESVLKMPKRGQFHVAFRVTI